MTVAKSKHLQLRQIAHIQSLKTDAAQARLVSANRNVRQAEDAHSEAVARTAASEDAWQASVAVHGMAADVTWSWSDTVRRDDLAATHAQHLLNEQEAVAGEFAITFRRQLIVRDASINLAHAAQRKAARKREETRLHEVTERLMSRWSRA